MNTTQTTAVVEKHPGAIVDYCESARRLRMEHGHPITSLDDARVTPLIESGVLRLTQERIAESFGDTVLERELGEIYVESVLIKELPVPIELPAWACAVRTDASDWPHVTLNIVSSPIDAGTVTAEWCQYVTFAVDADVSPDGETLFGIGEVEADAAPRLEVDIRDAREFLFVSAGSVRDLAQVMKIAEATIDAHDSLAAHATE